MKSVFKFVELSKECERVIKEFTVNFDSDFFNSGMRNFIRSSVFLFQSKKISFEHRSEI